MAPIIDPETKSKAFKLKTGVNFGYTFFPINPTELNKRNEFIAKVRSIKRLSSMFKDPYDAM